MATNDPLIDRVYDGRYRILRKLGAGGMANVYLAEDQELGRRVAIKILNDRHAGDEQFVERFRREAQNAAGLSHPNIVSIYDRGESDGTYYIAMEYVEGRTLKELIVRRGPSPIGVAIDYTRQVLAALRFAHRNGIVHRDIKPHNVIVDSEGRVKVADFGIARAGASQLTEAGSIVGTAQYLSPEQARGAPVDQTSDLYSAGIVLYELLTGDVPFTGDTPVEIAMKHLSQIPEPPSASRPDVPRDLDLVVLRALSKDPSERYRSAEEMDADLERVGRGLGVSAETAEAATSVLSGTAVTSIANARTAVTQQARTAVPPAYAPGRYYQYDEVAPRRRAIWPWLLALGLLLLAIVGGYYAYDRIQEQLEAAQPVTVPDVEGIQAQLAVQQITDAGLQAEQTRDSSVDVQEGYVISQDPSPGRKLERGGIVDIVVSSGKPKVKIPDVRGDSRDSAVAELTEAGLKPNVVQINSNEPENTVIAQSPKPGTEVVVGTAVRINVSIGPKPIAVPNVVGQPYESAASQLQAAGFSVGRQDVESDEPEGTVVGQSPSANSSAARGSSITLEVSEGPQTEQVPDVTSLDAETARGNLEASGFRVRQTSQDTDDPTLDQIVLAQDPEGGADAEPGSVVTIVVGSFTGTPEAPPGDGQSQTP
jgi:serine/threonine-protein kinase